MYLRLEEKAEEQEAIVDDSGIRYTYGWLRDFTEEFGKRVPERSLLLMLCRNTAATLAAHVACIERKIVPLMISARTDRQMREAYLERYRPAYIWLPEADAEDLHGKSVWRRDGYVLLETGVASPGMYAELALLLPTSGSTGSPKLVRHSYQNLCVNAEHVAGVFGFQKEDRSFLDLKLHYTMGLNVACSSLYAGAAVCLTECMPMQKQYWDFFEKERITNLTGVPYSYDVFRKLRFFEKEHPHLRILAEGGGRLSDAVFREIAAYADRTGKQFFATFGTSETTARLAFLPPDMALQKTGSIGRAIPGGSLFLADEEGREISEAEAEGELVYCGPNVTLGYAENREELALGDTRGGIFYTGDIARRDRDGCYYITGRKSRFLKLSGYRISLDETERLLSGGLGIESACTGNDQKMTIWVTRTGMEDKIRSYLSDRLRLHQTLFEIQTIARFPKSESGKILYGNLRPDGEQ